MINRLKNISKHSLARNSAALFALQFVNIVAPLVVLPYLSRTLGVNGFGLIMLALSACAIGLIITDFGFNLSATYKISKERKNVDYVSELIGAVFIIKFTLAATLLIAIVLYGYFIGFGLDGYMLPIYIGLNVLVQAFLPTWFFQGIEKMKNVTIYMVVAKSSYVLLVFTFVKEKTDVELVILFYMLSNFFAIVIAIGAIYASGYAIKKPVVVSLKEVFKDSSQYFLSRAAVSIYTSASTFLVGTFAGMQQAAMYGASEKLYQASKNVISPISQALFPYMAKNNDSKLLIKIVVIVGIPLSIGCVAVGLWANEILAIIFGEGFGDSGSLLQLFLIVTVVNFISVNFGYPAFAGIGKIHVANYTVILGALVQFTCLLALYITDNFFAIHVVHSVLITEMVVVLLRIYLYKFYVKKAKETALV